MNIPDSVDETNPPRGPTELPCRISLANIRLFFCRAICLDGCVFTAAANILHNSVWCFPGQHRLPVCLAHVSRVSRGNSLRLGVGGFRDGKHVKSSLLWLHFAFCFEETEVDEAISTLPAPALFLFVFGLPSRLFCSLAHYYFICHHLQSCHTALQPYWGMLQIFLLWNVSSVVEHMTALSFSVLK